MLVNSGRENDDMQSNTIKTSHMGMGQNDHVSQKQKMIIHDMAALDIWSIHKGSQRFLFPKKRSFNSVWDMPTLK